ncbi:MAG: 3-phosphoshikimate 1-carboxyvinyltransferase [Pseudomonadota bacterium]
MPPAADIGTMYRITPGGALRGAIDVPPDKSISHRAMMFGAVADGTSRIWNFLESEDCQATRDAVSALGATVERIGPGDYAVTGASLQAPGRPIDCGNAGTGMRLLAGLLAGQGVDATLVGDESLMQRPMRRIADPLGRMGADVQTAKTGCPPLVIGAGATLRPTVHQLEVASAQVKSALLLAALGTSGLTKVTEPARSRDHTERLLPAFGVSLTVENLTIRLRGPQGLKACDVRVPADPSSAAFFVVAATLCPGSDLTIRNVGMNPTRIGFLDVLEAMGADIARGPLSHVGNEPVCDLRVRCAALKGIDVPSTWVARTIDEFPILFIAAAGAAGMTRVRGARELRVKETDRLAAMAAGLKTLGIRTALYDDGIDIDGGEFGAGTVTSAGDHRIAMSFAAAGAVASGPVAVLDTANVATSFPGFSRLARDVGWRVEDV